MTTSKSESNATRTEYTVNTIKAANKAAGYRWFDPDSMRFFGTTVLPTVYQGAGGVYFVTSDKDYNGSKKHSVRKFVPETGEVETVGEVASYTYNGAINTAITLAAGDDATSGVRQAGGLAVKRGRGRPRKEPPKVTTTYEPYKPITNLEQFVADLDKHSSDPSLVNQTDAGKLMTKAQRHHYLMERMCSDPAFVTDDEGTNPEVIKVRNEIVKLVHRLGVMNIVFSGDPRGCTVKLIFKDGYTNDWGREGYCVPFRED